MTMLCVKYYLQSKMTTEMK